MKIQKTKLFERMSLANLICKLAELNVFQFGEFQLKSGRTSSMYVDMRRMVSYPYLLTECARMMIKKTRFKYDAIIGVPFGGIPWALEISRQTSQPALMARTQTSLKSHGLSREIEGVYTRGKTTCLIVEDTVTTGGSASEFEDYISEKHGIASAGIVCFFTYLNDDECRAKNICAVVNVFDVVKILYAAAKIKDSQVYSRIAAENNFSERFQKRDLRTRLKSAHLCFALDVADHDHDGMLDLIQNVGPAIDILKIHSDVFFFGMGRPELTSYAEKLKALAVKYDFLLMDDRKYCDIGNTVRMQLEPTAHIFDLVTAHAIAGPGTFRAITKTAPHIGIVVVAQMSSVGTLTASHDYQLATNQLCKTFKEHVVGVVAQNSQNFDQHLFVFTPGISLNATEDNLGQTYRHPSEAIKTGTDIIIVGRGIYEEPDPLTAAGEYRACLSEIKKYW